MMRTAIVIVFIIVFSGCSTAPIANLLDWAAPGPARPDLFQPGTNGPAPPKIPPVPFPNENGPEPPRPGADFIPSSNGGNKDISVPPPLSDDTPGPVPGWNDRNKPPPTR